VRGRPPAASAPADWIERMTGSTLAAWRSACARWAATAGLRAVVSNRDCLAWYRGQYCATWDSLPPSPSAERSQRSPEVESRLGALRRPATLGSTLRPCCVSLTQDRAFALTHGLKGPLAVLPCRLKSGVSVMRRRQFLAARPPHGRTPRASSSRGRLPTIGFLGVSTSSSPASPTAGA
jgi:hypothetical protein